MDRIVVPYDPSKMKEEIERVKAEYPDYEIVEYRDTIEGSFLVLEHRDIVRAKALEEEIRQLKETAMEALLEGEDISNFSARYKRLKQEYESIKSRLKAKRGF